MRPHATRLVWLGCATLLAIGAIRYHAAHVRLAAAAVVPVPNTMRLPLVADSIVLQAAAASVIKGRAFHSAPAPRPFAPATPVVPRPVLAPPPKPELKGIVGGPPWSAVITGLPNTQGAVVLRPGDTVAGHSIVRIKRDTVVLRGKSTTWTLAPGRP